MSFSAKYSSKIRLMRISSLGIFLKKLLILSFVFVFCLLPFSGVGLGRSEARAASSFQVQTGYYVGTGSSFSITGLGFQPALVMIKASTAVGAAVFKTSSMPSPNLAFFTATADDITSQLALDSDGFTLGTAVSVNSANVRYTYTAFSNSDCSAGSDFCVGFYVGDGSATKTISTGFQPDLVWVKRSASSANWASSAMPANTGQYFDATNQNTGGALFTTLTGSGFTVGSTNNANLGVYYYVAFKSVAGKSAVGTFTGDGTNGRVISGVGFTPDWVYVKNANAAVAVTGVANSSEAYGDSSTVFTAAANATGLIQSLQSDSFTVGSGSGANGSGNTLYWAAFDGAAAPTSSGTYRMANGSYTGTGAGFSVTGLEFAPDLVIIKHHDQATDQYAVFRTRLMSGDTTSFLSNPVAVFAGGVTALGSDGFTIGTNATVNTAADTYYWTAFGNAWSPSRNSGASDFVIGAYLGNGGDDRQVKRLPFSPDLVAIKSTAATAGVWRTSAAVGDFSFYFGPTAGASNLIQTLDSNGFQIGTDATVNTAATLYHWFAFKNGLNFSVGSYTGTGSSKNVTTPGFSPNLLWIKAAATVNQGVMRSSVQAGNAAQPFANLATISGAITGLLSTGFTVGTAPETNSNSVVYQHAALQLPDLAPPTSSITYSDADAVVKAGDTVTITATFNEPLADSPVVRLSLSGANTLAATPMTKASSTVYTYPFLVGSGNGAVSVTLSVGTDIAGNIVSSTPSSGGTFTVDNIAPTSQDTVFSASDSKMSGATVSINSSGVGADQVWFAPTGTTVFSVGPTMTRASSGTSTSILAPATQGVYKLFVLDPAGNVSSSSVATLTVTNINPTVSLSMTQISPTNASPTHFTATFSTGVTGFNLADIIVGNGSAAGFSTSSASVYTFTVSPSADGTVTVDIPAAAAQDLATNTSLAASQFSFVSDRTAPSVPVPTPSAGMYSGDQSITLVSSSSSAIRYTIDGGTPTCSSGLVYGSSITLSSSVSLNAVGCDAAGNISGLLTANYTISSAAVNMNTGGGGGGGGGGGASSLFSLQSSQASNVSTLTLIQQRVAALPVAVHSLIKLPDDGNPKTQVDSAVYYVGADGLRHAFTNTKLFNTWYCDFSQVQVVQPDKLASIGLGQNVLYRAGLRMVKFTSVPKVYLVAEGGVLRPIKDEATARGLYGTAWNKLIDDISDAFYTSYQIGPEIGVGESANPSELAKKMLYPSDAMAIPGYAQSPVLSSLASCFTAVDSTSVQPKTVSYSFPKTFRFAHDVNSQSPASVDIRYLQEFLMIEGDSVYPEGRITGNYGAATEAAVRRYQAAQNLPVTGALDAKTRSAINKQLDRVWN